MHLIYIANIRWPTEKAHGYQIGKMCEEFSRQGLEVELWLPNRYNDLYVEPFSFYNLQKIFKVRIFKGWGWEFLTHYCGRFGFGLQKLGFYLWLYFTPFNHETIVYTREVTIAWILRKRGLKVFFEAHDWPRSAAWFKFCLKSLEKVVVISRGLKQELENNSFSSDRILVAPDGVDLNLFTDLPDKITARQKLGLPTDKKLVMYTGHLYPWKGVTTLIDASHNLSGETQIVLVGGNLTDLGISALPPKVVIKPPVKHEEVPNYLVAADVLVLPNSGREAISKHYTSPLKLFEYLAAGRVIVASDLPALREILSENTAIFFKPDDPGSLVEAINSVLNDNNKSAILAAQAKTLASQYDWSARAKSILNFIFT